MTECPRCCNEISDPLDVTCAVCGAELSDPPPHRDEARAKGR